MITKTVSSIAISILSTTTAFADMSCPTRTEINAGSDVSDWRFSTDYDNSYQNLAPFVAAFNEGFIAKFTDEWIKGAQEDDYLEWNDENSTMVCNYRLEGTRESVFKLLRDIKLSSHAEAYLNQASSWELIVTGTKEDREWGYAAAWQCVSNNASDCIIKD